MLSGIKVGKAKAKRPRVDNATLGTPSDPSNRAAAAALRDQLVLSSESLQFDPDNTPKACPKDDAAAQALTQTMKDPKPQRRGDNDSIVIPGKAVETFELEKEDFRFGSRQGKVKRKKVDSIGTTIDEANMSIQDMMRAEKDLNQCSMDEIYARNVARIGSRFKGTEHKAGSSAGADEEDFVDAKLYQKQNNLTKKAVAQREMSRQIAHLDKLSAISAKCWWWIESPSFRKHMLIALGNHASLVMAPSHISLFPGECFYIVPLQHSDSLVRCDHDVWNEVSKFQNSLRSLFIKEDRDVVFMETVLGSKGFWQTRLVGIPIPRNRNDAPMYFKQAMLEQSEEWGTHNKILATSHGKGLKQTIPVNFNYFYVEWSTNNGFAQIIENNHFPADFGVDTLAGMLNMDPIRFQRQTQHTSPEKEKKLVLQFLEKWKPVDWTLELDE